MKIEIIKKDLIRQTFRCGGKGGQNVNKIETGVRYIYKPLEIVSESTVGRTQEENEKLALEKLVKLIQNYYRDKIRREKNDKWKIRDKNGFGEKYRRTYYLAGQKKVVDHVTGKEATPNKVLNGDIDCLK